MVAISGPPGIAEAQPIQPPAAKQSNRFAVSLKRRLWWASPKRCYGASDERTASSSRQLNRRGAPSPPSGWIEDLHLQAVDHARHITKGLSHLWLSPSIRWWRQPGSNR